MLKKLASRMNSSGLTEPNYQLLFERGPGPFLALEPDAPRFTIIAVSDAYERATFTRREAILGRGLFEVFPDNPGDPKAEGKSSIRASLERVLRTRAPDAIAFQKYDIRRPGEEGGEFEEHYWNPVNFPVIGPTGDILYIIHSVEDVTDFVRLERAGSLQQSAADEFRARAEKMEVEIFRRAREVELAKQREESELRLLAEAGAIFASTLDYEETLTSVAELAVREFADVCIVDIFEETGEVRRLRTASRDPALAWACDVLTNAPFDRSRPHIGGTALASKRAVLMQDISKKLVSFAQSEERLRALRAIDPKSAIVVPLRAHDQVVGIIAFLSSARSQRYGPVDLALAEAIAVRAALSIENARLYRATRRALQDRDDVLGIIAHDLRNPLSVITMQANLMSLKQQEPEERGRERIEAIQRSAVRMSRMIQDLVDVARLDAGSQLTIQRGPVSVSHLVEDCVEDQRPLIVAARLELQLEVEPELPDIWADRDRVLQVLENLVGNAVKFTQAGGRLTIGAAAIDGAVRFSVEDTGVGIPREYLLNVFDRFWQVRNERRGSGLGLAIVKVLVEAHGGRVWVESDVGRGATFCFTIPTAPAHLDSKAG